MTQKPFTYVADIAHLPEALAHLTTLKRWVVWRWELRTKKNGQEAWTKPPFMCAHPRASAKSNDPSTWGTYEAAVAAVASGLADGIGFMLKNSEVAAGDLDHVRDAQTGELLDWASKLCAEADHMGLYIEVTVSGCGLRFIGLAQGGELHRKFVFNRKTHAGIELYRNCARFITISGLQQGSCEALGSINAYLDTLLARYAAQPAPLDFNNAGPQAADYFRDIIENGAAEGERSEKFQEVVWHLAATGWTIEQIVDELAKYPNGIGLKFASRLLDEVTRSFNKWTSRRRANVTGSATPATGAPWPQIKVIPGELPRADYRRRHDAARHPVRDGRRVRAPRAARVQGPALTRHREGQSRQPGRCRADPAAGVARRQGERTSQAPAMRLHPMVPARPGGAGVARRARPRQHHGGCEGGRPLPDRARRRVRGMAQGDGGERPPGPGGDRHSI
jgi:hypothetical protein